MLSVKYSAKLAFIKEHKNCDPESKSFRYESKKFISVSKLYLNPTVLVYSVLCVLSRAEATGL